MVFCLFLSDWKNLLKTLDDKGIGILNLFTACSSYRAGEWKAVFFWNVNYIASLQLSIISMMQLNDLLISELRGSRQPLSIHRIWSWIVTSASFCIFHCSSVVIQENIKMYKIHYVNSSYSSFYTEGSDYQALTFRRLCEAVILQGIFNMTT